MCFFHQGKTALLVAARFQPTVVQILIEAKSDLTATNTNVSLVMCCVFDSSLERSLCIHSCDIACFDMALRMRCDLKDYGYDTTTHMDVVFDAISWYVEWYG